MKEICEFTQFKYWEPYISPYDPCPPIKVKNYPTPPQLYITFQPKGLPQYDQETALFRGTLWPALDSPYPDPHFGKRGDANE
ncbi:spore coat associated protein CotJA [Virgibacillus necropolis]|uniref:Spore coat protein CotJA n=1 Tax=Virgibacillus necropolis TaxID=163877 RepID=A0A221MD39_9BACI|nr:spore coat associated protein CotJA [Virgibacillus necropolis]ASN05489.1 spore coat protein CotJA [Virgibacillus necropolis]